MLNSRLLCAGVLSLAAIASAAHAQTTYTLTDVGTPAGCDRAYARGVNAGGDVAASCYNGPNGTSPRAFAWRAGTVVSLGLLPKGAYSDASAISATGVVAGYGDSDKAGMLGFVTTSSGLLSFFSNNGGFTRPMFVGRDGFIGGRYTTSKSGWVASIKGAIWTPDPKDPRRYRKTDLPIVPGGIDPKLSYSHPNGFNEAGLAAGFGATDEIGMRPIVWLNDAVRTIVMLPLPSPGTFGEAVAINNAGQVAGIESDGLPHPVFWQNDAAHTVSALPVLAGHTYGSVVAMNDAGDVVGHSGFQLTPTDTPVDHVVVWQAGQVLDLQTQLDTVSGAGYTLVDVAGINGAGQIAATATRNGVPRAVLLTPVAP